MAGLDNPLHIAMLLVVVLLVFGAKRLPEMGKSLGEGLRGFKDSMSGDSASPTLVERQPEPAAPATPTLIERQPEPAVPAAPATERTSEPVA
jgi:sec-independent protein translocase protein TatA